jgi:hypothetical protein
MHLMVVSLRYLACLRRPCLAGLLATLFLASAHAGSDAEAFEPYGKIYPEWKVQRFGRPSLRGAEVGTMGSRRNDRVTLSKDAADKEDTGDHEWSNSYVGIRGQWSGPQVGFGYDVQVLIDLQGAGGPLDNLGENLATRDAILYVEFPALGRIAVGKMDSIYKEWGDRGRMFGITSGNFISTSRLVSGAGWRGEGDTSFHNRRSHTLGWFSPAYAGWEAGVTHSYDEMPDGPGGPGTELSAAAVRWSDARWYAALETEVHRNWLPLSRNEVAGTGATSILNRPQTTTSRDQAWRLSLAWTSPAWKLTGDIARLRYAEADAAGLPGKFRSYANRSWQLTAEYRWSDALRLAGSHVRSSAGECALSAGLPCSTAGLGGEQTGLGVFYAITRTTGLFAIAAHTRNGPGSRYGSAPQGASIASYAIGIKFEFDGNAAHNNDRD